MGDDAGHEALFRRSTQKYRPGPVEGGTSNSAAARFFGVSPSSVKRYLRIAQRGASLAPRKKKGGARPPKTDQSTEELLKREDVKERPAATVTERRHNPWSASRAQGPERLHRKAAALKRLGFEAEKTDCLWGQWSETNG